MPSTTWWGAAAFSNCTRHNLTLKRYADSPEIVDLTKIWLDGGQYILEIYNRDGLPELRQGCLDSSIFVDLGHVSGCEVIERRRLDSRPVPPFGRRAW